MKRREVLNGIDANYIPLMRAQALKWRDRDGEEVPNLLAYFREKGVSCFRLRVWYGEEGPSRLPYALGLAREAASAGFLLHPMIFLSEGWADLYKQPAPKGWEPLDVEARSRLAAEFAGRVAGALGELVGKCAYFQVGNEIDYGICGVFARDKKKRKSVDWLRRRIWPLEARILKAAFAALKDATSKPLSVHLGRWFDANFVRALLNTMDGFGLEYDVLSFSFYPTHTGAPLSRLEELRDLAAERGVSLAIAEYAYPSRRVSGQFWFMNNPSPGYPMTLEGQARWLKDFLLFCKKLGVYAAFYWSPELYLTKSGARRWGVASPLGVPLDFGWGPMSLFRENGVAKPAVNSLAYGR
jgi:arabinogalactan endo-1,4-beta-galactosidase